MILIEDERDGILSYYSQFDHYPRINWTIQRVRNLKRALEIEGLIKADRVTLQRTLWRLADAHRLDGKALRDNFGSLLHFVMLASLTRELGLEETDIIVNESMGRGDFTQSPIVKFLDRFKNNELLNSEHMRAIAHEIYGSPVAHEFARKEAYLAVSPSERFDIPLELAARAEIRLNAIPEGDSPELASLIDSGLEEIYRSVRATCLSSLRFRSSCSNTSASSARSDHACQANEDCAHDGKHLPNATSKRGDPFRRIFRVSNAQTRLRSFLTKPSHV